MRLVICEKPKVAEKIANALGGGKAAKKSVCGVPYYEVEREGELLVVVSAVGHLYSLRQQSGAREYPVFNIEWAPAHEVEKGADYSKKYLDAIRKLCPEAEEYVCACDFDVEGSLIGYNVIRFACGAGEKNASRMKFSALTDEDLEDAYVGRGKLDAENALAGEARHMLDWFYGINLSRALMSSIRSAGANQIMSIGRVQGPALSILAKKEKEVSSFVPEPYFEVTCEAKDVEFCNSRGRIGKKADAEKARADSKSPGVVSKVQRREHEQLPSPPFDLTSLQVEAYRAFGFPPAQTLELAQSLYEASMISYPRTGSQKLPAKLNPNRIIEALSKLPQFEKSAKKLLAAGRSKPLEGNKDDPAHPAIHPTGVFRQMGEREMKLYDIVAKRFLACFDEPARREAQKVEIAAGSESYFASGNRTVYSGWFETYAPYVKLDEIALPQFSEGETVPLSNFLVHEKKTQPPKRYTPASIVSELEKRALGTKATRATIVETLFKRSYLEGKGSIKVTPFGMAVHESLSSFAPEILDEELTHTIEDEMEKIQDGENEKRVVEHGKAVLTGILSKFDGKERDIGLGLLAGLKKKEMGDSMLGKCVKCGSTLRAIRSRAGKMFVGCTGYPKCTATYPLPQQAKIIPLGKACEKCGTPIIRVVRKGRRNFDMCIDPSCETKKNWGKPQEKKEAQAGTDAAKKIAPSLPQSSPGKKTANASGLALQPTKTAKRGMDEAAAAPNREKKPGRGVGKNAAKKGAKKEAAKNEN